MSEVRGKREDRRAGFLYGKAYVLNTLKAGSNRVIATCFVVGAARRNYALNSMQCLRRCLAAGASALGRCLLG